MDAFREECKKAVEKKKADYLNKLGNKLDDPGTTCKSYWKIINRVMNKCRAPRIPPILSNIHIYTGLERESEAVQTDF